ncbi:MAG TPA: hypothetical protein VE178_09565 [Silvibacterium sp.]|nr:hypothetical protein [Silvibacterium sp.]
MQNRFGQLLDEERNPISVRQDAVDDISRQFLAASYLVNEGTGHEMV